MSQKVMDRNIGIRPIENPTPATIALIKVSILIHFTTFREKLRNKMIIIIVIALIFLFIIAVAYTYQSLLIFQPTHEEVTYKYKYDDYFEEISLETGEGKVYGLYFTRPNSKGTVLYFHGNGGSLDSWGSVAPLFLHNDWDILITDYRGYGKSRVTITEEGLYDDAEMWYNYIQERSNKRIIIYGRSIGTGIAVHLATIKPCYHLMLETPYTSLFDLVKEYYSFIPKTFIAFKFDNKSKIKDALTEQISLFHGTKDEVIPYHHSKTLHNLIGYNLITIEGGRHNNLAGFQQYQSSMKLLLK